MPVFTPQGAAHHSSCPSPAELKGGHIKAQSWPKDPRDVGPWQQLQGCGVLLAPR